MTHTMLKSWMNHFSTLMVTEVLDAKLIMLVTLQTLGSDQALESEWLRFRDGRFSSTGSKEDDFCRWSAAPIEGNRTGHDYGSAVWRSVLRWNRCGSWTEIPQRW